MRKMFIILLGPIMMTCTLSAAMIKYSFDESNVYAATSDTAGVTASDIAYHQGSAVSDDAKTAAVSYESNIPSDNMFAVCSADIQSTVVQAYTTTASRLEFGMAVNSGNIADFNGASLFVNLSAITDRTGGYTTTLRLAYNINDTGWVVDSQRALDISDATATAGSVDSVLYDDSTDALLGGYIVTAGASMYTKGFGWDLSGLGELNAGDTVEFAFLMYDGRVNAGYYTAVDDVRIANLNVVPEPAAMGVFAVGVAVLLVIRRCGQ